MAAPIYNPVIPCVHPIPAGMYPGRMIRVQGSTPPGAQRFAINLQCGPNTDPRDDIALHLNFRFVEMCVVRNHLTAMNWGVEDTAGGMPLRPGDSFEALILCEPQSLKIALNGMHFCEFLHRLPFQRISHITVDGDAMVQFIGFEGAPPPQQQMYMAEPPAYGQYGAPPSYGAPGYGPPQGVQPQGARPQAVAYPPPMQAGGPQYAQGSPQYVQGGQAPRSGMGAGAATGLGVGALAAGGLAGYALGGGFGGNEGSPNADQTAHPNVPVDPNAPTPVPPVPTAPPEAPPQAPPQIADPDEDQEHHTVEDQEAPSEDRQEDGEVNEGDNDWLSEEQAPEAPPETVGTPEDNDWLSEEQPAEETSETEGEAPEEPAPEEPAPEDQEPENEVEASAEEQAPPEEPEEDPQEPEEEHGGDDDFGDDDWIE